MAEQNFFNKWYWVIYTIKGAHIHLNPRRQWYFEKNKPSQQRVGLAPKK